MLESHARPLDSSSGMTSTPASSRAVWAPDVHSPDFSKQAHRQSLAVAASASANDNQSFIDALFELQLNETP
ncbi:MAG: antitoxin MazE-like protein [Caldilineaceae bacterium]